MRIIILGNGPSVLNNKYGYLIDTFDEVVRINHYKPEKREYVGSKVTTYTTSTYKTTFYKNVSKLADKILIWDQINCKNSPYDNCQKTEYLDVKKLESGLQQKFGFNIFPNIPWCTTGVAIVEYFIQLGLYDFIYIYGFDYLRRNDQEHYFSTNKIGWNPHSQILEENYFNYYLNNGTLKRLEDFMATQS